MLAEPLAAGSGATIEAHRALGSALHGAGMALEATGADGRAMVAYRRPAGCASPWPAMNDLRRAAEAGHRNPAAYGYEPALGPLWARDDFRLLMLDLDFPADPFAR